MNRVNCLSRAVPAIAIVCQVMIIGGCSSDNPAESRTEPEPMQASLVRSSDCLPDAFGAANDVECFEYSFDRSGVLTILHHNAGFNCCPDSIHADIKISEDTIIFDEHEGLTTPCRCLCLYDVEYQIDNVAPGTYTLVFNDSYIAAADSMLCGTIDLAADPEGAICFERTYGPWSEPAVASMTNYSDCLDHYFSAGISEECFEYAFDGSSVLTILHHNTAFNCCPDSLYAEIDFDDHTITFNEYEGITMPCECLCLYNTEYRIENLAPGTYTLIFDAPYARQMLTGTINLETDPEGSVCQERGYYPWPLPPSGFLAGFSDCQTGVSARETQTCVDYYFDGYSTLELMHVNAWYNCCLDSISASFAFSEDSIIVSESEWLADGGCDCICPINIHFYIENLPPGVYTLVIGNANVDPVARQSVVLDLSHPINSSYCFEE